MGRTSIVILFFVAIFGACQAQKPVHQVKLPGHAKVVLLDSARAAQALVFDQTDGFFEKITAVEMSIQLKKPLDESVDRSVLMAEYLDFLRSDVEDFTPDESRFVAEIWEEVGATVAEISGNILPREIKLIKTKARHVGESVYYTRENCIVIPKNELEERDEMAFLSTMYHELFHVYSRLNPEIREKLYAHIGFRPLEGPLSIPVELKNRIIHNPDGVNFAQAIDLAGAGAENELLAVPVIFSNQPKGFMPKKLQFFSYVDFALFQVKRRPGGTFEIITNPDGSSTLDLNAHKTAFYGQIRDNTNYIIHPDEVLADNFSFIMLARKGKKDVQKFSPEGQKLLVDIESIIRS